MSSKETQSFDDVHACTVPAFSGQLQILKNHAEAFILLEKGSIILQSLSNQKKEIVITGGVCYVKNNMISVIL